VNTTLLFDQASQLTNLDQAFRWALSLNPALTPHDVVIQDEYTHDVIFGEGRIFLVFDAT
jgi:hypothetical protein